MTRKDWIAACAGTFVVVVFVTMLGMMRDLRAANDHALECIDRLTQHVEVLYLNYSTLSDVVWDEHGGD